MVIVIFVKYYKKSKENGVLKFNKLIIIDVLWQIKKNVDGLI